MKNKFGVNLLVCFVVGILLYLFAEKYLLANILFLAIAGFSPLMMLYMAYQVAKTYGFNSAHGKAFSYLSAGFLTAFIATAISLLLSRVFNYVYQPLITGIIYLLSYAFYIVGISIEFRLTKIEIPKIVKILSVIIGLLIFYLIAKYNVKDNLVWYENLTNILLRAGEFLLFVFSTYLVRIFMEYKHGKVQKPWIFISLGFFIFFLAGIVNLYTSQHNLHILIRFIGAMSAIYGLYLLRATILEFNKKIINKKHHGSK